VTLAHLPLPDADQPHGVFPYVEAPYGTSRGLEIFGGARLTLVADGPRIRAVRH
jgi:hypothetical protein